MNANDFTYLLNNPTAVNEQQALLLDKIVAEFPYFQSARALQLKVLNNQNSFRYNQSLKVTAAHTTDRNVLFEFITSEDFAVLPSTASEKVETISETISIAESPEEIIQISHIPVEKKVEESIPTSIIEIAPETESKAETISDTISIAESPDKIMQISHIPVEQKIDNKLEQSILSSINEATPAEKTVETETAEEIPAEEKINSKLEQSILSSINEATPTEKTIETETAEEIPVEEKINSKLEQSILSSINEATPAEKTVETDIADEIPVEEKIEEKTVEEKLEIGQPLDFSKQEKHSFQEWLQLATLQPIKRAEETETPETEEQNIEPPTEEKDIDPETQRKNIEEDKERKKKSALIDKFIETNPKISPASKNATVTPFVSEQPAIENSYLMTETLAKVYLEQKKYQKAIQAYEILILKYPEKISFFANRISDIKALQQNNN